MPASETDVKPHRARDAIGIDDERAFLALADVRVEFGSLLWRSHRDITHVVLRGRL